jgi:hypothetical protein
MGRRTRKNKNIGFLTGKPAVWSRSAAGGTRKARTVAGGMRSSGAQHIVPTFLQMLNTVKLYHWKTTSFATHKATDELYGTLGEKIDEFVEVMLGKGEMGGRAKLLNTPVLKLTMFSSNDAFKKQVEIYKKFLLDMSVGNGGGMNVPANTDLLAIRDEILAALNQFLYLLTLH